MTRLFSVCLVTLLIAPTLRAASEPSFAAFDRRAKAGEHLQVVFFGASLTWGANATDPQLTSYRAQVGHRLEAMYPDAHFTFWDGAIGGTNSQLGVFRLERDVLRHHPDLVFLDFSANDDISSDDPETLASYEAIVRRILLEAKCPVVQVMFPFKWDADGERLPKMKRRDAHLGISAAYGTAIGDAISLAIDRVRSGQTTLEKIWPADGVHPGNAGYELFADAALTAFKKAVDAHAACHVPEKMLYADTYMSSARIRLSSIVPLPQGWRVGAPHLTSAFYDMLMSRWLDDETIASNRVAEPGPYGTTGDKPQAVTKLEVRFRGRMALLFGESTAASGKYRLFLDGAQVEKKKPNGAPPEREFDAGSFARAANGNVHHVNVVATNLDPAVEHVLIIEPLFTNDAAQELRLESLCVAGAAQVAPAVKDAAP